MIDKIISILPMVLPLVCILLIAIFYAIQFKKKINETIFLSIATIIIILFISGILNFSGSLLVGYTIIVIFSLVSLIILLGKINTNRNILKEISLFPNLIIFFFFLCFSIYLNYGRMFIIWDEFSHWGTVIKSMYTFNALGTFKDTGLLFKAYLPGISLFQYFLIRPFLQFTEYPAYIGLNLIYFSIVCTFIKRFSFKNILFVISSLLIPLLMGVTFYSSLYVDCILGLLFGGIFLFYFYFEYEKNLYGILMVAAIAIVLTLTKDMGFVFAFIGLGIIFLDFLLFKLDILKNYINKTHSLISNIKNALVIFSPLILVSLFELFWRIHLKIAHVTSIWLQPSKINIKAIISGDVLPYQHVVIGLFKDAVINKPILPLENPITKILIILIIIIFILGLILKKKNVTAIRLIVTFIAMIAGNVLYIGVLFIFYVFLISPYEALILASYERYIFSYLIGLFFSFLIFLILEPNQKYKLNNKSSILNQALITTIIVTSFYLYHSLFNRTKDYFDIEVLKARESVHNTINDRKAYDIILKWSDYLSNPDSKPYIIAQGDIGYTKLKLIYILYPTNIKWITDYSVSLEPYYPALNDPWTKIVAPKEWEQYVLNNYNQIYIFKYDQNFKDIYGYFFDKLENDTLYEVTRDEFGNLKVHSLSRP